MASSTLLVIAPNVVAATRISKKGAFASQVFGNVSVSRESSEYSYSISGISYPTVLAYTANGTYTAAPSLCSLKFV